MCGRYSQSYSWRELVELYRLTEGIPAVNVEARYNAAPTQRLPVVVQEGPVRSLRLMRWGLLPAWTKDPKAGPPLINARAETVAGKPAFRAAFKSRRCLVPANGYYEWQAGPEGKLPWLVTSPDGPLTFAGLWERWQAPEGPLDSFTIVTTAAAPDIAWLHDRMPVVLPEAAWSEWLDPALPPAALQLLLQPLVGLGAERVSTKVNSNRNEGPDLIRPIAAA